MKQCINIMLCIYPRINKLGYFFLLKIFFIHLTSKVCGFLGIYSNVLSSRKKYELLDIRTCMSDVHINACLLDVVCVCICSTVFTICLCQRINQHHFRPDSELVVLRKYQHQPSELPFCFNVLRHFNAEFGFP